MQDTEVPFKLLLFIDRRPSSVEQIRQIRHHLDQLANDAPISLEVIDVSEQPYMVEHFKLVATPVLIKLSSSGQQTLAGSDIISQLDYWWPHWQQELQQELQLPNTAASNGHRECNDAPHPFLNSLTQSTEVLRLSDEIFRLEQAKAELEAQLQFKDRIIAMLAHDLRNPLTAASIAVETLELGYNPDNERFTKLRPELTAQLLRNARTQIRAIDRMITDILQAARGANAELQIVPKELDLKHLCYEILESIESNIQARQQTLDTDIPQDLPTVHADVNQIRRVIVNLLDNAIKYTPKGGKIKLMALHRTTQKVQISIHDTGPGIPADNHARIFEESFRLKRDQAEEGYGLGLALCLRIVRAHYGQIWVDSVSGEGSAFHFTLPVYRAAYGGKALS
jgi:two-component system clock-associated histidine kinase SasA